MQISRRKILTLMQCLLLVASVSTVSAQASPRPLWTSDTLHSPTLGQTRKLRIALPADYDSPSNLAERYPVLIVLDAQWDLMFASTVANSQFLAVRGSPAIPRLIVVGVENDIPDRRYHDMMPPTGREGSGGGAAFLDFLKSELSHHIAQRYRTLPYTVLMGHSMSGLFAAWTYGQAPDFVSAAIAISPSTQEDTFVTRQVREGIVKRGNSGRFYIHNSADETVALDSTTQAMVREVSRASAGRAFRYDRTSDVSHLNTPLIGAISGLQFVFAPVSLAGLGIRERYRRSSANEIVRQVDEMLAKHESGTRELGLPNMIPLVFLTGLTLGLRTTDLAPALLHICEHTERLYPLAWNGAACAGEALALLGRTDDATRKFNQAVDLARRAGDNVAVQQIIRTSKGLAKSSS